MILFAGSDYDPSRDDARLTKRSMIVNVQMVANQVEHLAEAA